MSNLNPRRASWANDVFTERVLVESGRRTMTLSDARKAEVLKSLLAEAARIQAASAPSTRSRPGWLDGLARLFSPRLVSALGAVATLALVLTGYVLYGGVQAPANANLNGVAAVSEQRRGVFGLSWSIARQPEGYGAYALHHGDDIVAVTPVTITFADGSQTVAAPGTRLSLLTDGGGVALIRGEIANSITPSADGSIKFRVESATGTIEVKGTEFRVRTEADASVMQFTDEGLVGVKTDTAEIDVQTGEQTRLQNGLAPVAQLQIPRVSFETRVAGRVLSEQAIVPFSTRIFPGATLIVVDAITQEPFAHYVADADGLIKDALPPILSKASLRFSQSAVDGRTSDVSEPVEIVVDETAPTLGVSKVQRDGDEIRIVGRTELGATVRVNDAVVTVKPDGSFEATVTAPAGMTAITIAATDAAGNTTSIVQTLQP
jgi:hypothetical protein